MTFDEWFQSKQGDPYASMWDFAKEAFAAGAASRDAEIAELVSALEWVRKVTVDIEMHDAIDFALAATEHHDRS